MKKVNLSVMAVLIIILIIILITNALLVYAYQNQIISIETRKNNMQDLSSKYTSLLDDLHSNAKLYMMTCDDRYLFNFYSLLDQYKTKRAISPEYYVITTEQAKDSLKDILVNSHFTAASNTDYIQLNHEETKQYSKFIDRFNFMLDYLTISVTYSIISSLEDSVYYNQYQMQSELMSTLSKSYVDRLNTKHAELSQLRLVLEQSLIVVALLLLTFASVTFYYILNENARNSYFSKLFNTVVENIDGGLAILDSDYHFDYINTKYRDIFCIESEDIKGKSMHDIFDKSIAQNIESTILDDKRAEGKYDIIVGNKKKSLAYSYIAIEAERSNIKYLHIIRDTTKTEELELQLRKQLKEIRYYSQAKDSFIANISHEIKTPINAILGMVHFLKNTRLSLNQRDLVRKIETSSDILLTIISDVLDLSKMKSNSLNLYPSDFSLATIIKSVEDMFSSQLSQRRIELLTEYNCKDDLCVHLDRTRFVQVLVNLINNASKFTDSGYIKLSVDTVSENDETLFLQFCVEDTGIGISEADVSKIFREFEQLENHLTKQHQGTGLGLFICKNIVESMDGKIWVKSIKGKGSKFYFALPAQKSLEAKLNASANSANAHSLWGNGGKALVVEDTEINSEVAVKLLNAVNIACDTACDGISAIEICKDKPADHYNVILMDIHMPKMDGYTAANILKKEMGISSPILAVTASDIDDQIRTAHAHSITSFILKPFKASAFYNAIAPYFPNRNEAILPDTSHIRQIGGNQKNPLAGREEAIHNLGGVESIYYKHVKNFKANYANSAEKISTLLAQKDYEEARRLAHSIKGLGGTLGMPNVMEASAELEKAILKGDSYNPDTELKRFDRELKYTLKAI